MQKDRTDLQTLSRGKEQLESSFIKPWPGGAVQGFLGSRAWDSVAL